MNSHCYRRTEPWRRASAFAMLLTVLATSAFVRPCFAAESPATQPAASDAFEQNRRLGRGVNIIGYDPLWKDRTKARFKAEHFKIIHDGGFAHVRINLHPFRDAKPGEGQGEHPISDAYLQTIDWAVDEVGVPWDGTPQDRQALAADLDKAQAWAKAHERPLYLGEFGAYDKADMSARARYADAVARGAEQRGWSWAWWQLDGDFVAYDIRAGHWVQPIHDALIPLSAVPPAPAR
jgi:hypothetical protein